MISRIYLVLFSLLCFFAVVRRSKKEAKDLLLVLVKSIAKKDFNQFFYIYWGDLILPNYKLKGAVTIGRSAPSFYRKFSSFNTHQAFLSKLTSDQKARPSYLVIRDGAMGDVLMMTPAVRALYEAHDGEISIDISTHFPDVFANSPYVRKLLSPKSIAQGVRNYDCVINLNGVYERMPHLHPVDVYIKFCLGVRHTDRSLQLFPLDDDREYISGVVRQIGCPYIVVHRVGHEWPNRKISNLIWDEVIFTVSCQLNFKVIYVGSVESAFAQEGEFFEDHRDRYTLQQLSLFIASSSGYIGVDSGPAHVAATTKVPICVFYTCAHHQVRMPLRNGSKFLPLVPDIDCYGCLTKRKIDVVDYSCERGDNACVSEYYLKHAAEKVRLFLSNAGDYCR